MDELRAPPENLYKVIGNVFNEFWQMDYPENVVNAFLARINKRNCADYGLSDFATESCSLPVIQVRPWLHLFLLISFLFYKLN